MPVDEPKRSFHVYCQSFSVADEFGGEWLSDTIVTFSDSAWANDDRRYILIVFVLTCVALDGVVPRAQISSFHCLIAIDEHIMGEREKTKT